MPQIRINSILGGQSPTTHFAAANQFRASLGIDPSIPISDTATTTGNLSSGLLRPTKAQDLSGGTVIHNPPLWIKSTPKDGNLYIYDTGGSIYTIDSNFSAVTGLGDLTDGGTAGGNGMEYYDNYVYFSRDTTVARYGPLNGTPTFTDNYWNSTLGKTALTDTQYPKDYLVTADVEYPNHVLHRHSDGRLYIADVVGNQGTIHFIQTRKTTVEGDTDDGSTYGKVQVGYGLYPTAMESYGTDLVIAFWEGVDNIFHTQSRAKIAFWDTASANVNKLTWVEFPDPYISSIKNVNGVLYITSGRIAAGGFRVSKFVGGYTFEEVALFGSGVMPYPGAITGQSNQLIFGTSTDTPAQAGTVYSLGLNRASLGNGVFSIHRVSNTASSVFASALYLQDNYGIDQLAPTVGWTTGANGRNNNGVDIQSGYGNSQNMWWSQVYRVGQPFKITKIRIPLATPLTANHGLGTKVYIDTGTVSTKNYTFDNIGSSNYGTNTQSIVLRPTSLRGDDNFWLELTWTGNDLMTVSLPITIEYELLDVDTVWP